MVLHFLKISLFQKTHSLFKLIHRAAQLQQTPKYDIFQKGIFWTFSLRYKSGTKRRSNCSRAVFMKSFYFFLKETDHFLSFKAFLKKQNLKSKFPDNLGQNICRILHVFSTTSFHHKWIGTRLLLPESESTNFLTSCWTDLKT